MLNVRRQGVWWTDMPLDFEIIRQSGFGFVDVFQQMASEIGRAAGTALLLNSRGIALADFWNRGVIDIAVAASTDRHALLRNTLGGARHWLGVELVGTESNRDAVGARVYAKVGSGRQMREVVLGDGYGSQNSLRQYFGLGEATTVDELVVRWPRSATSQTFRAVAADRIIRITEGRDEIVEARYVPAAAGALAPEAVR